MEQKKISGIFLSGTLAVLLIAIFISLQGGSSGGFSASIKGDLEAIAINENTIYLSNLAFAVAWITQFIGLAILYQTLNSRKGSWASIVMLSLAGFMTLFGIVEATFNAVVTTSVSQIVVAGSPLPELYPVLDSWVSLIKRFYLELGLIMNIFLGLAFRENPDFPSWMSQFSIAWGGLWFISSIIGLVFPALLFIVPIVIGVAFLLE